MMQISKTMRVALVGVALAGMTLTGCDRFRSAETIAARGDAQYTKGNFRAAVGDFKNALQRDETNVTARIGLARAQHHLGEFDDAQHSIDRALKSDASNAIAVELKHQILLSRGQYDEVITSLAVDSVLSESTRTYFIGLSHVGLRQYPQAASSYARALELSPTDVRVLVAQAQLYAATGELLRAGEVIDKALSQDAENAAAWVVRAGLRDVQGDTAGAKAAIKSAETFAPRQLNFNEKLRLAAASADISLRMGNAEDAARALGTLVQGAPQSPITGYLQARLSLLNKNSNDAVAHLQKGLQSVEYLPSRLLLANLQLTQGNYQQAESHLNKVLSANPDNADARRMLSQLYIATNRAADAQKLLALGLDKKQGQSDSQVDWLRGQALFVEGAQEEGLALLEKSVAADRTNVDHSLQLARAYIASGARAKAVSLLESLPVDAGGTQRQGLLVLASVLGKSPDESAKAIDGLLLRYPKDSKVYAVAGVVIAQSGDPERGAELLNKAIGYDSANTEARILLGSILLSSGKYAEAERQFQAVKTADDKNLMAYAGLAKVAFATDHKDQGVRYLEQAIGVQPSAVEPRLQLAQIAIADHDEKRAISLLEQAVTAANGAPALVNAVGVLLLQMQKFETALAHFEKAAAAGYVVAQVNAARALIALGKKEAARQRLEPLTRDPTVRLPASALLVRLDADAGKYPAALATIDGMRKFGDAKALDELEGDVYVLAKQYDQAQLRYGRAYQKKPTQQLAIKRYQALLAGRDAKAHTVLTAWLAQSPKDLVVRQLLAKHYVKSGDNVAALPEYEAWLSASPVRDPEILNDLAWLYGEKGDARALPLALEAYTARPASSDIADTYGWLLLRRNEAAKALPILEKAAQSAQANPEVQYHYAVALSKVGDRARAKTLLQDLVAKSPQFPSRREAEQLLQTVSN